MAWTSLRSHSGCHCLREQQKRTVTTGDSDLLICQILNTIINDFKVWDNWVSGSAKLYLICLLSPGDWQQILLESWVWQLEVQLQVIQQSLRTVDIHWQGDIIDSVLDTVDIQGRNTLAQPDSVRPSQELGELCVTVQLHLIFQDHDSELQQVQSLSERHSSWACKPKFNCPIQTNQCVTV
jgi:hypothetical protein